MAHLQWTDRANDAFTAIILDRRQRVGFVAARVLRQRIMDRIYLLREFPYLGRRRSTNEEGRELVVPPYIVAYQVLGDTIVILDLFHAHAAYPNDEVTEMEP